MTEDELRDEFAPKKSLLEHLINECPKLYPWEHNPKYLGAFTLYADNIKGEIKWFAGYRRADICAPEEEGRTPIEAVTKLLKKTRG